MRKSYWAFENVEDLPPWGLSWLWNIHSRIYWVVIAHHVFRLDQTRSEEKRPPVVNNKDRNRISFVLFYSIWPATLANVQNKPTTEELSSFLDDTSSPHSNEKIQKTCGVDIYDDVGPRIPVHSHDTVTCFTPKFSTRRTTPLTLDYYKSVALKVLKKKMLLLSKSWRLFQKIQLEPECQ